MAFAEPQVTMAQGAKTPGTVTVAPAEAKKAQADDARMIEKKNAEAEYLKKMTALEQAYESTSDPEVRKAIKEKMMELREDFPQPKKMVIDFSDPVSVEKALQKVTQSIAILSAKSQEITALAEQEKLQRELDQLSKMQQELKARLAQLQAAKQVR